MEPRGRCFYFPGGFTGETVNTYRRSRGRKFHLRSSWVCYSYHPTRETVSSWTSMKGENKTLGWDDSLPNALLKKWLRWQSSLEELSKLSIRKCFYRSSIGEINQREIHAFSNASEIAIATVIYIRLIGIEVNTCVSLLYAQAKLPPKQATTIPRLSVNAVKWITRELKLNKTKTVF